MYTIKQIVDFYNFSIKGRSGDFRYDSITDKNRIYYCRNDFVIS